MSSGASAREPQVDAAHTELDGDQLARRRAHRERIWQQMMKVCRPDSRFHWDFSMFIADFEGSDQAAAAVQGMPCYQQAPQLFITPDNATEDLRRVAMLDGKTIVMTTYAITRGFLLLEPGQVPAGQERYAATLDGMDRYARPVTLHELAELGPFPVLATGGSAVALNGVRFGKGHGYFDLEWAMLSEVGCATEESQILDLVHDCQVVEDDLVGLSHDAPVDWIVTPTRVIHSPQAQRTPGTVRWDLLDGSPLAHVPPIEELRARRN